MTSLNKRILSGVFGFCFAVASVGVYKTNAENEKLAGDINADGVVTSSDYPSMVKYFTNQIEADKISVINADINEDGKVNIVDVIMLKESLLTPKVPETTTTTVSFTEPVTTTSVSEVTTTIPATTTTKAGTTVTESVTTVSESVTVTSTTEKTTAEPIETTIVTTTPVVTTAESTTTPMVTTTESTPAPAMTTTEETTAPIATTTENTTTIVTTTTENTTTSVTTTEVTTTTLPDMPDPSLDADKVKIAEELSKYRVENGTNSLQLDTALSYVADIRAKELPTKFSITRPDGTEIDKLMRQYKLSTYSYHEYICSNVNASRVISKLKGKDWLLKEKYNKVGIGYIYSGGKTYWDVVFSK